MVGRIKALVPPLQRPGAVNMLPCRAKEILKISLVTDLEVRRLSWIIGWPQCNHKSFLIRGRQEDENESRCE